jgi:hypothetical protein
LYFLLLSYRYDPTTKLYYYANLKTGASMWERPKVFRHLYPKSKW